MKKELYFKIKNDLKFEVRASQYVKTILFDVLLLLLVTFLPTKLSFLNVLGWPILLFRSFGYMHEAVHGVLFKNKILNNLFGVLHGAICFLPFEQWKKIHIEHHLWTGNPLKDPTLEIVKKFPFMSENRKDRLNFFWQSKIPFIAFLQQIVFWKYSLKRVLDKKDGLLGTVSIIMPIFIWSNVIYFSSLTGLVSLGIGVVAYLALVEFINWPHHLDKYQIADKPLPRWEQALVARTCRYNKYFERYIALNFNFHSEHHLFPELPWYNLYKAHCILLVNESQLDHDYNSSWLKKARSKHIKYVMHNEDSSTEEKMNVA